jgi:hypothetical protein
MPNPPRRPGRIVDIVVIAVSLFVFVGLAVYHYRRLDRHNVDAGKLQELAEQKLPEPTTGADWPQWRGPNRVGVST